ncbi:beta strand repeat-containing protein, partial [Rhizobium sp. LjRoot30]|uniref:beta strand repeat-containing protein n=1 Tax=Rhizobium sp. LjRoot30 TaxID=3342320 RepID=UPI003F4F8DC7
VTINGANDAPTLTFTAEAGLTAETDGSYKVDENNTAAIALGTPVAIDLEDGARTVVLGGDDPGFFTIGADGKLYLKAGINYEDANVGPDHKVSVTLTATDSTGAVSNAKTVTVTVNNVNDAPTLTFTAEAGLTAETDGSYKVDENNAAAIALGTPVAIDPEDGARTVVLGGDDPGFFTIGADGKLYLKAGINYEDANVGPDHKVSVTLTATDSTGAVSNVETVTVTVNNVNEAPTTPTDSNIAANTVTANAAVGTAVGITATATDVDNASFTWSLSDNAGGRFAIDANGVVTVAQAGLLAGNYDVKVRATDAGGLYSEQTFTINATSANVAPVISNFAATATGISFTLADPDSNTFTITDSTLDTFLDGQVSTGSNTLTVLEFNNVGGSIQQRPLSISDGQATGNSGVIIQIGGPAVNNFAALAGNYGTSASYGFGGNDTMYGSTGLDYIFGGGGNDTIYSTSSDVIGGGDGDDIIHVAVGGLAATIDGGNNTNSGDRDILNFNATSGTLDLTGGTITNIETLTSNNGSYNQTITLTAAQYDAFSKIDMGGNANGTGDTVNVNVDGTMDFTTGMPTVSNVEVLNLIGSTNNDTVTVTNTLSGFTSINLGDGTADTLRITGGFASSSNGQLVGIENVMLTTISGPVTLNLSNQSENLTITGGSSHDTIIGGDGNDTIIGGNGGDYINGGGGRDSINLTESTGSSDDVRLATLGGSVDTIIGFSTSDDYLRFANGDTSAGDGNNNVLSDNRFETIGSIFSTGIVIPGNSGNTSIYEFNFTLEGGDLDLDLGASSAANLYEGLRSGTSSALTSMTVASDWTGFLLAYQDNNAYIYYANAGSNGSLVAGEVSLVAVVTAQVLGSWDADEFYVGV